MTGSRLPGPCFPWLAAKLPLESHSAQGPEEEGCPRVGCWTWDTCPEGAPRPGDSGPRAEGRGRGRNQAADRHGPLSALAVVCFPSAAGPQRPHGGSRRHAHDPGPDGAAVRTAAPTRSSTRVRGLGASEGDVTWQAACWGAGPDSHTGGRADLRAGSQPCGGSQGPADPGNHAHIPPALRAALTPYLGPPR